MLNNILIMITITPFKQSKIAVVSDLHFGVHQNNQTWHTIAIDFAKWFKKQLIKNKIQDIVICGDVNNDRNEISVNTMHVVNQVFKLWKNFNIKIIIGNHDAYYKDRCDVNSLSVFAEWSNIDLIDEVACIDQFENRICFCPWSTEMDDIPKSDIIFGHFDVTGFKMNKNKICAEGIPSHKLIDKGSLVVSGHFHTKDERKYNNGTILYTGSPYELNWGDCNEERGFYLLDLESKEHTFICNNISPKHKKIRLSEFLALKKITQTFKKEFTGNFVKFIIDQNITTDKLDILINKLNSLGPISLQTEFELDQKYISDEFSFDSIGVDISETIQEFINLLDLKNKKEVLNYTLELYKKVS